jgi:D-proline reductase (dithiol) PrdB
MYRPHEMNADAQAMMDELDLPRFEDRPFVRGTPLAERRIALISSAGLQRKGDRPFSWAARDYRAIGRTEREIVMSHISVDYDRTGFQQDLNTIFPLDRLDELARDGVIGSVAETHYSFMGATDPLEMEPSVKKLSKELQNDKVDTLLLVPV